MEEFIPLKGDVREKQREAQKRKRVQHGIGAWKCLHHLNASRMTKRRWRKIKIIMPEDCT